MSLADGTPAAPPHSLAGSGATPAPVTGWVADLEPLRPELLGPRSVPELVDRGFAALRRHPRLLMGSALLFLLPATLITALVGEGQPTPGLVTDGSWWAGAVSVAGFSLAAAMLGLPMARAVALEAAGIRPTWRRCHALGWRIWLGAAVTWALLAPVRLLGVVPVVTVAVISAWTLQLSAVQSLEGVGPRRALGRMMGLGRRSFGRALGLVCLQVLVGWVLALTLGLVPLMLILRLPEAWQRVGANLLQLGLGLVLCPAAAWTAAAFHLDERIRRDGLDLEVGLDWWSGTAGTHRHRPDVRADVRADVHADVSADVDAGGPRRYTPLKVPARRRDAARSGRRRSRVGRGRA
ncbi:MAG: hypothetical protein ACKV2O_16995 [Acidimicrobiales bacterium]